MYWEDLTDEQKKEVVESSGYTNEQMDEENPLFIEESDFEDYVEELLIDTGDLPRDLPAYIHIDWESTAKDIKIDYSYAEIEGSDYLFRAW